MNVTLDVKSGLLSIPPIKVAPSHFTSKKGEKYTSLFQIGGWGGEPVVLTVKHKDNHETKHVVSHKGTMFFKGDKLQDITMNDLGEGKESDVALETVI